MIVISLKRGLESMKGYVWYHDQIYGGTREEYLEFCEKHDNVELVMTLSDTTIEKVKTVAESLNRSNFLDSLKNRQP